jgi:hypothetical protein
MIIRFVRKLMLQYLRNVIAASQKSFLINPFLYTILVVIYPKNGNAPIKWLVYPTFKIRP